MPVNINGDLAIDGQGNLFQISTGNSGVYKITPEGISSNLYNMNPGSSIIVNSKGAIFISNYNTEVIYNLVNNMLSVVAGKLNTPGDAVGQGDLARFDMPYGLTVDENDNIYIADIQNKKIKRMTPTYNVTTIASNVDFVSANLSINATGDTVYTQNSKYQLIRIVAGKQEIIAGDGNVGYKDGIAAQAQFSGIQDLLVTPQGDIFMSDFDNDTGRWLRYLSKDGYVMTLAAMPSIGSMVMDKNGVLYVVDGSDIKKVMLD